MREFIPYGKQWIDDDDVKPIAETAKSNFITQGPRVVDFENALCKITGAKYAVVVCNGTAALHLAVAALHDDSFPSGEGITSPNTFLASSNAMIYNDLKPIFADIDAETFLISPQEIEKKLNSNTRVIIPVHFAGQTADMEKISVLAKKGNIPVIEDAAHAIGSTYADGSPVGNCKYSEMTIFSFHPVKTITTGEGGAIMTNSETLYKKLIMLRSHGVTKENDLMSQNPGDWYYEMQYLGFNYRMTDFQGSLGISQLKKLGKFAARRRDIVETYNRAFKDLNWLKTPVERHPGHAVFHLYVLQIDFEKIGQSRKEVMDKLRTNSIGTQVHYIPVHIQPYYQKRYKYAMGDFPITEKFYSQALSIPLYPKMTDDEVAHVIDGIKGLYDGD